ncbi:MAG: hypothetical protein NTX45_02330 [Proteobacteria bacterium]|nr:hypothetical protein [Pseudomonadota bacterium]
MATPYQPPTVTFTVSSAGIAFGNPSYFDLLVTGSDPLSTLATLDAWCVDWNSGINV